MRKSKDGVTGGWIYYKYREQDAKISGIALPYHSKLYDRRKAANCWIYLSKIDVITAR